MAKISSIVSLNLVLADTDKKINNKEKVSKKYINAERAVILK